MASLVLFPVLRSTFSRLIERLYGYDVFISYTRRDDPESVFPLAVQSVLTEGSPAEARKPMRCFLDRRDMPNDAELRRAIADKIRASRFLLIIAGPQSANHRWMRFEARLARRLHKRTVVVDRGLGWQHSHSALRRMVGDVLAIPSDASSNVPDPDVISRISNAVGTLRMATVRSRLWLALTAMLLAFLGLAVWQWRQAITQRDLANRATIAADTARQGEKEQRLEAQKRAQESRRRLIEINVATGLQRLDSGDDLGALPWFGEALGLEHSAAEHETGMTAEELAAREWPHRFRIGAIEKHAPRVAAMWRNAGAMASVPSHDGSKIAFCGSGPLGGEARVWEISTGHPASKILPHDEAVTAAAFSEDDRRLTTVSGGAIRVWDLMSGEMAGEPLPIAPESGVSALSPDGACFAGIILRQGVRLQTCLPPARSHLLLEGQLVSRVDFSPRGTFLATTRRDVIDLWRAATGEHVLSLLLEGLAERVAFSADEKRLLAVSGAASTAREVRVWDTQTGQSLGPAFEPGGKLVDAAFSPDGSRIVVGTEEGTAWLAETSTGRLTGAPMRHQRAVRWVAFSPSGRSVVTIGEDAVRIWDDNGAPRTPWLDLGAQPIRAIFDRNESRLLTVGFGGLTRVWQLAAWPRELRLATNAGEARCAAFNPTETRLATGAGYDFDLERGLIKAQALAGNRGDTMRRIDKPVQLWDVASGAALQTVLPHETNVRSLAFSDDGSVLFSATDVGELQVWDIASGRPLKPPLPDAEGNAQSVAFSSDGRYVALVERGTKPAVLVIDRRDARPLRFLVEASPIALALSADSRLAVAVENVRPYPRLCFFDVAAGKAGAVLDLPAESFYMQVCFSPDARYVAVGALSGKTQLVSFDGTPSLMNADLPTAPVLAFSRDSRRLATASSEGARVWDLATGRALTSALRHEGAVMQALFAAQDRVLVTRGEDRAARLWDATSGRPLTASLRHSGFPIRHVAASPSGRLVATSGGDGSVRLWEFAPALAPADELRREAALRAGRVIDENGDEQTLTADGLLATWDLVHAADDPLAAFRVLLEQGDEVGGIALLAKHPQLARLTMTGGVTALHLAAGFDSANAIEALLKMGVKVDVADEYGATALHVAAMRGAEHSAIALIASGAPTDAPSRVGHTPLFHAAGGGRQKLVALLLARGAAITAAAGDHHMTPLHAAAVGGYTEIARLLLDHGAPLDAALTGDLAGSTSLHLAISSHHRETTEMLLDRGADLDAQCPQGNARELASRYKDDALAERIDREAARRAKGTSPSKKTP